jgi:hypothetical protein
MNAWLMRPPEVVMWVGVVMGLHLDTWGAR